MTNRNAHARGRSFQSDTPVYSLYGEVPELGQTFHSNTESIEVRSENRSKAIEVHVHLDLYQFVYIYDGATKVITPSSVDLVESPCLILVPPHFAHGFEPFKDTAGQVITINASYFDRIAQSGYLTREILTQIVVMDQLQDCPDLVHSVETVLSEHKHEQFPAVLAREAAILSMLVNFLREVKCRSQQPGSNLIVPEDFLGSDRAENLLYLIDRHYSTTRDVKFYANKLKMSVSNINKISLQATGRSVHANITMKIVSQAKAYLLNTDLRIKEISYRLGFADPAYFTRFFTKNSGVSPGDFRNLASQHGTRFPSGDEAPTA